MSITTPTPRQRYAGNGVTVLFPIPFQFDLATDLLVLLLNTTTFEVTTQIMGTDYSVTGGSSETGMLTMVTAPPAGYTLVMVNNLPATQDESLEEGGSFPVQVVESALDRNALIAQRALDMASRSIRASDSDPADVNLELPPEDERADTFLAFDSDGGVIASPGPVDTLPVSAYAATLLDDANAAAARTTLDVLQKTSSMTALTTPATDDFFPIADTSDSDLDKKITPENLLKVIGLITEYTDPIPQDFVAAYDSVNSLAKRLHFPGVSAAAKQAGWFANIGFTAATDVLTIGGANASQSSSNPAYLNLPDTSSFGRVTTFRKTADVPLTLGTAHFGFDTLGNLTNAELWVIAINDGSGTLKYGITVQGGLNQVVSTFTETVAANVTLATKILVNATLAVGTWPCFPLGYVLANRNDATNAWTLVTTVGGLNVGGKIQDITGSVFFNATFTGLGTVTGANFYHQRVGNRYKVWGDATCGTVDASTASISLPNSRKIAPEGSPGTTGFIGRYFKSTASATTIKAGPMTATSGDAFATFSYDDYTTALSPFGFRAGNAVFTNSMTFSLFFDVPILGLSNN